METISVNQEFNIADILRYAPKGLKLYSPMFGEVKYKEVKKFTFIYPEDSTKWYERIIIEGYKGFTYKFKDDGRPEDYHQAECLLFPSVNHRCWNHWQNTLFLESIGSVCVDTITGNKFILDHNGTFFSDGTGHPYSALIEEDGGNYLLNSRYATPEETKEFLRNLKRMATSGIVKWW